MASVTKKDGGAGGGMEGSGGEYSAEISKSSKSAKLGDEHRGWLNNGVGMDLIFSNSLRWVDVGFVGGGGFMGRMIVGIVKGFVGSARKHHLKHLSFHKLIIEKKN